MGISEEADLARRSPQTRCLSRSRKDQLQKGELIQQQPPRMMSSCIVVVGTPRQAQQPGSTSKHTTCQGIRFRSKPFDIHLSLRGFKEVHPGVSVGVPNILGGNETKADFHIMDLQIDRILTKNADVQPKTLKTKGFIDGVVSCLAANRTSNNFGHQQHSPIFY